MYWKDASGAGAAEELLAVEESIWPGDWSRDGRHIAIRGYRGSFFVWDVVQQRKLISVSKLGKCGLPNAVAFSPDGRRVVCIATRTDMSAKGTAALIWRVGDGRLEREFKPTKGGLQSVAWSPDGAKLAFAGNGKGDVVVCDDAGILPRKPLSTGWRPTAPHRPWPT